MPELASFQDLYDEYEAEVVSDPDTELSDFSPGSRLDAYAGVAATAAQSIMRWIARQVRRVFISTAAGDDLDFAVEDRYGSADEWLRRRVDESDDDYRTRVLTYAENLGRGTMTSLDFYLRFVRTDIDPTSIAVTEDLETGIITLSATASEGEDAAAIAESVGTDLPEWRPAAHGWVIDIAEAA